VDLLRLTFLFSLSICLSGCQIGYVLKSAGGQLSLLNKRVPIEKALLDDKITEKEKEKIRLAQKAREFAIHHVGLTENKNYTDYVSLDRPYVTYVVSAAEKWELKKYEWSYPFLGKMPYKGYFNEADAKNEEQQLQKQGLDTYLRGVSAYSTLGWFRDPLLSSMTIHYKDHDLVNTIIHETVHATLYIKNSTDFNERMAVFVGNTATEDFYRDLEGPSSPTLKLIQEENTDEKLFSTFISKELEALKAWYQTAEKSESVKAERLKQIQERYKKQVLPRMKTDSYRKFTEIDLNNARLLIYETYVADLSDFEKLFSKVGKDYRKFLDLCKTLEKHPKPEAGLKNLINPQ
jgi:predicted aminopeptidase